MNRQERILLSKNTTWEWLMKQIAERQGGTFAVMGVGERARKLVARLLDELPEVVAFDRGEGSREHFAIVGPTQNLRPVAWFGPS